MWQYNGRLERDENNVKKTEDNNTVMQLFSKNYGIRNFSTENREDSTEKKVNEQPHNSMNVECPYGAIGQPRVNITKATSPKETKSSVNQFSNSEYITITTSNKGHTDVSDFLQVFSKQTIVNQLMVEPVMLWLIAKKLENHKWFFMELSFNEIEEINEENIEYFISKINKHFMTKAEKKQICFETKLLRDRKPKCKNLILSLDKEVTLNELRENITYVQKLLICPIPNKNCMGNNGQLQQDIMLIMKKLLYQLYDKFSVKRKVFMNSPLAMSIVYKYLKCASLISKNLSFTNDQVEKTIIFAEMLKNKVYGNMANHIRHIRYVSNTEYKAVIKLVYDVNNIKAALEISYANPKLQRNILIESVYESVYKVLCKTVRYDPFKAPNIDTIYGSPPFEQINIRQILINFSRLYFCGNKEVLTFKQALKVTKFLLRSFDLWMWTVPDKKSYFYSELFSKPYSYYFCRYMVYCEIPRLAHSISPRYKATMIFGREVLRYTLESFYKELQVWCYESNIICKRHRNSHCLNYVPMYINILKTAYEDNSSPIWNIDYSLSDVIRVSELSE